MKQVKWQSHFLGYIYLIYEAELGLDHIKQCFQEAFEVFVIEFQVVDICSKTVPMFEEYFPKFLD